MGILFLVVQLWVAVDLKGGFWLYRILDVLEKKWQLTSMLSSDSCVFASSIAACITALISVLMLRAMATKDGVRSGRIDSDL